jgi:hypothetical protein
MRVTVSTSVGAQVAGGSALIVSIDQPKRPQCSDATEHADHAVVTPGVRNGIDVRSRCHGGRVIVVATPSREEVPCGVVAYCQSLCFAPMAHPGACLKVDVGEQNARDRGRRRVREFSQLVDPRLKLGAVDIERHAGRRLTSL